LEYLIPASVIIYKTFGTEHVEMGITLNILSVTYMGVGKYASGIKAAYEAFTIFTDLYEISHKHPQSALKNLK